MKEFQRNLNTIVIHYSNTDLGGNSNSNILTFKVKVKVILHRIVIDPMCATSKSNITLHCN